MNDLPGDCGKKYRVKKRLAEGGFGVVLLAVHQGLDREVVIKVPHVASLRDEDQVRRFKGEARVAAMLNHDNIVKVLDYGCDDGTPWIVYEFIRGETLRTLLGEGRLRLPDAILATAQVARALEAAHARGIVHRDVKPENVLRVDHFLNKLTDFGIARWSDHSLVQTGAGMLIGTPSYLCPAYIRGADPSPQTDIYALGVMLFELVSGRLPFTGPSPAEILRKHLTEPHPPLGQVRAGIPPGLEEITGRALAKDPAQRTRTAAEMAAALEAITGEASMVEATIPFPSRGAEVTTVSPVRRQQSTRVAMPVPGPSRTRWLPAFLGGLGLAIGGVLLARVLIRPEPISAAATPRASAPALLSLTPPTGADGPEATLEKLTKEIQQHRVALDAREKEMGENDVLPGRTKKRQRILDSDDPRDRELSDEARGIMLKVQGLWSVYHAGPGSPGPGWGLINVTLAALSTDLVRQLEQDGRRIENSIRRSPRLEEDWIPQMGLATVLNMHKEKDGQKPEVLRRVRRALCLIREQLGLRSDQTPGTQPHASAWRTGIEVLGSAFLPGVDCQAGSSR